MTIRPPDRLIQRAAIAVAAVMSDRKLPPPLDKEPILVACLVDDVQRRGHCRAAAALAIETHIAAGRLKVVSGDDAGVEDCRVVVEQPALWVWWREQ